MTPERQYAGIFKICEVPGSFGLRKFQYFFQVRDAHFFIFEDQMQYSEPRFIGARLENLGAKGQIETF
jgi:hypothetical protein